MRRLVIGILAHVDAGKTTLSEALLYGSGAIRTLGRVDHGDAFLDTDAMERERGITIFSKQAVFTLPPDRETDTENGRDTGNGKDTGNGSQSGNRNNKSKANSRTGNDNNKGKANSGDDTESETTLQVTLLDTPGHADFSAEMERTLRALDCAVLVVSGTDGVQGHTRTVWRLLEQAAVPVFLFVNKMDLSGADRAGVLEELKTRLDSRCVDFGGAGAPWTENRPDWAEDLALCREDLLERFLDSGELSDTDAADLIRRREAFPCYFGSALKAEGVDEFLTGLYRFAPIPDRPAAFGARIFKITRDSQGNRLAWMKMTGGTLKARTILRHGVGDSRGTTNNTSIQNGMPGKGTDAGSGGDRQGADLDTSSESGPEIWEDKADQLRIYSGIRFKTVDTAEAGMVVAVTGLRRAAAGEGLGYEPDWAGPSLAPVLQYRLLLSDGTDPHTAYARLKQLEEEDPQLHAAWDGQSLSLRLMGDVQLEILRRVLRERFGMEADFDAGAVTYRETIAGPAEGIGHFEPLRHYAEVRLLLRPLPRGSGLMLDSACPEDVLDRNWQRLILTHLAEREHRGVLTGSPITDIRITLTGGRAHVKHTEGGDFREATYRAVRQGLMGAESVLLEPWYEFRLEVPSDRTGRAMADLQRMNGDLDPPETVGEDTILTGSAPVSALRDYAREVAAYTRGLGRLHVQPAGYRPCADPAAVIAASGYDPDRDVENPSSSVFCSHGGGVIVPWNEVPSMAHADSAVPWEDGDGIASDGNFEAVGADSGGTGGGKDGGTLVSGSQNNPNPSSGGGRAFLPSPDYALLAAQDKELQAIFRRTYGERKERRQAVIREARPADRGRPAKVPKGPEYLLVDGYNIIYAWDELHDMARENLDAARKTLCDLLCEYRGVRGCVVIVVFDAYRVKGNPGSHEKYRNIDVVYTKEAETADAYIERATYEIGKEHRVRVATSDGPEQLIILGHGALRVSASMFREEMAEVKAVVAEALERINRPEKTNAVRTALTEAMENRQQAGTLENRSPGTKQQGG